MKFSFRDILAGMLTLLGVVVMYAKLQSYSWWLIGSWKGAMAVLAVIGLAVMLTNIAELVKFADLTSFAEAVLWAAVVTLVAVGLFATATKAEFVSTTVLIALAWVAQITHHEVEYRHNHKSGYMHA